MRFLRTAPRDASVRGRHRSPPVQARTGTLDPAMPDDSADEVALHEALRDAEEAAAQSPGDPTVLGARGDALAALGTHYFYRRGLGAFNIASRAHERAEIEAGVQLEDDPTAYDHGKEFIAEAGGYYRHAVGAYDAALRLDRDSASLHRGKARALH